MKIDDLPSAFLLTDKQVQQLKLLPQQIVEHHVQVLNHEGCFYHLNPDLEFDVNEIVLCPICAEDPMIKNEESIAAGNDYGRLAHLKPLNGTTQNTHVYQFGYTTSIYKFGRIILPITALHFQWMDQ